ncbi:MAG TPA: hypothetical protein VD965_06580 [Burkholderiales bacterium]|nr:hypothetical protein [Burkholderiales bacterium]
MLEALPWGFLGAALLFLGLACRDAARASYADMGVQMGFSAHWMLASLMAGVSIALLVAWWAGIAAAVLVFALRWPAYRIFQGTLAEPEPPPRPGFKEFIRNAEKD